MNNQKEYILPTAYFGPVQYYCRVIPAYRITIEQYDNYSRQTYRNRCTILGANGPVNLSIPVKKQGKGKTLVKDIVIDYDTNWQKDHYRGIISAYTSSPFFEFYFDDYRWVFSEKPRYLIDLNMRVNEIIMSQLELQTELSLSNEFKFLEKERDLRNIISPKSSLKEDKSFKPAKYTQVFSDRFGFIPNLSVIDLLFNTGPEAVGILKESYSESD